MLFRSLFKYVKKKEVYLCPKMVADGYGTGVGSGTNGHFDYAIFQSLPGAKLNNLKHAWYKTTTGQQLNVPTFPVLVQENAISFNGGVNQEGGHSKSDRLATCHNKGSYLAGIDGSIFHWVEEPTGNAQLSWWGFTPSSTATDLGEDFTWGQWNAK